MIIIRKKLRDKKRVQDISYYQKLIEALGTAEDAANQYETVTTIIRREHYDPANGTLYPVSMMDVDRENHTYGLSG